MGHNAGALNILQFFQSFVGARLYGHALHALIALVIFAYLENDTHEWCRFE